MIQLGSSILLREWAAKCCPKGPHAAGVAGGAAGAAARAHAAVPGLLLGRVALNSRAPVIAPTCAWVSFVGSFEP